MPLLIALISAYLWVLGLFETDPGAGTGTGQAPAAGTDPQAGTTASGGAAPASPAATGEPAKPASDGQAPAQEGTKLTDPTELQQALNRANAQAASERNKRQTAETRATQLAEAFKPIAKALGLDAGGEPDPAQLQQKLAETTAQLRAEKVNNAFYRVASQVGANPELTLRYLRGGNELADLDPAASDFEATLKTIVQAAIDSTPALKAAPQAGGSFDGGPRGGASPAEPEDLAGLIAQRVTQQRRAQA